jgi:hypothetical protein
MQSVEKESNALRCLSLCLVQYGTRGKCRLYCRKKFLVTLLNCVFIQSPSTNESYVNSYAKYYSRTDV